MDFILELFTDYMISLAKIFAIIFGTLFAVSPIILGVVFDNMWISSGLPFTLALMHLITNKASE